MSVRWRLFGVEKGSGDIAKPLTGGNILKVHVSEQPNREMKQIRLSQFIRNTEDPALGQRNPSGQEDKKRNTPMDLKRK